MTATPLLEVLDLRIRFATSRGFVTAVDGISFSLDRGQTLGIVGESGSGKSATSLGIMRLHSSRTAEIAGRILLDGEELLGAPLSHVRRLRGSKMSMIFQDPLSSLNPYYTVGAQISEAVRVHNQVSKKAARQRAIDLLRRVAIPEPASRVDAYPHTLSGGMRQRVMIAIALSCQPALLIADEPTTALDVTVQAQILDLIADLQAEHGMAVIVITHDLGVVAELSDHVLVMYGGKIVEEGSAEDVFLRPDHPYTWGLLNSSPQLEATTAQPSPIRGNPPSLADMPSGCVFHPRCDHVATVGQLCSTSNPTLLGQSGHLSACHLKGSDRAVLRPGASVGERT